MTSLSFASLGESAQITATARNASGGTVSVSFVWTSQNSAVASVSSGLVTAAGNGSTTIQVTAGGLSGSIPHRAAGAGYG